MKEATGKLDAATQEFTRQQQALGGLIGTVRGRRTQGKWLASTAAAALVVGLLLSPWAARLLPFGWDAQVAASIMRADRWNAGQALMKSANPTGLATLAAEINVVDANQDALSACRESAQKSKKEQLCSVVVPAL